jgi:hypothetical protein
MKLTEILNEDKPRSQGREGDPYWELDLDNKVYVVYDSTGTEVAQHTFPAVWDSSKARNAAQKDVNDMKSALRKKQSEDDAVKAEAKPLSPNEERYLDLARKVKKYTDLIYPPDKSPSILDTETKDLYLNQATEWIEKMNRLGDPRIIRKSVLNGTYKPAQ